MYQVPLNARFSTEGICGQYKVISSSKKLKTRISCLGAVRLADCTHRKFQFISNFSTSALLSPVDLTAYQQGQS